MSRPASDTVPLSGRRCPVIRLNSVDLPAPLGPITAAIWRAPTLRLTSETARKPAKDLHRPATSSTALPPQPAPELHQPADNAAGEEEQQYQQNDAEDKRPVLRVVGDRLVEPDQRGGADRRAPEKADAAEDGHDHHLGRFRPEHVIGKDPSAEDAVER